MGFNPLEETKTLKETYTSFYKGIVRNVDDPQKLGRIKVEILPMFKGVFVSDLPWAERALQEIPGVNSWVWVFFEEGQIYNPVYFAQASPVLIGESLNPIAEGRGFPLVTGSEAGRTCSDTIAQEKETQAINTNENTQKFFPEESDVSIGQYPDNNIKRFKSGIVIEIDDTPGNARIHIFHPSNTYVDINKDGLVHVHSHGQEQYSDQDIKVGTQQNLDEKVGGNVTKTVGGNILMDVGGNVVVNTQGLVTINSATSVSLIAGANITLTSGGTVTIN